MVRPIVRDVIFLSRKSEPATRADVQVGWDLLDTLKANAPHCVGMAANMIGVLKNVIVVNLGVVDLVMFNPVIVKQDTIYEVEEGCLSLTGVRRTNRFRNIEVEFYDFTWRRQRRKFTDWPAQIIQHEIDHCRGIVI